MATNEPCVEQSTASSGVGHRKRNSAQCPLVVFNGFVFSTVVHIAVLCCLWKVELLHVLAEAGWQIAHQEIGLLNGLFWIDETVSHLRTDDGIGQTGRCGVGPSWRTSIRLGIVAGEQMVQHVARVGQKVGWKGRPVFGQEGCNGLKRPK